LVIRISPTSGGGRKSFLKKIENISEVMSYQTA